MTRDEALQLATAVLKHTGVFVRLPVEEMTFERSEQYIEDVVDTVLEHVSLSEQRRDRENAG